MSIGHSKNRWEASATVAVDTNWFSTNIAAIRVPESGVGTFGSSRIAKFTLQIMVPTSTVVEVDITDGTTNKTGTLNGGTALTANAWYIFDILVEAGFTFNIQHKTGTQNVACKVFESDNLDI